MTLLESLPRGLTTLVTAIEAGTDCVSLDYVNEHTKKLSDPSNQLSEAESAPGGCLSGKYATRSTNNVMDAVMWLIFTVNVQTIHLYVLDVVL